MRKFLLKHFLIIGLFLAPIFILFSCSKSLSVSPLTESLVPTPTPVLTATPTSVVLTPTLTATPHVLTSTPTTTATLTSTFTPTPTATPVNVGAYFSPSGYRYTLDGGTTSLSEPMTIHVGQSVIWDTTNNGIHPLYLDDGVGNCVITGNLSFPFTQTFNATGSFTFHCGNHGTCNGGGAVCTLPCSLMFGNIQVIP